MLAACPTPHPARGFTCNAITIAYYGAPLSTVVQVIRTRSSSTIYLPMCIANLVNTLLWIGYGFVSTSCWLARTSHCVHHAYCSTSASKLSRAGWCW